jgi:hypothetical protein
LDGNYPFNTTALVSPTITLPGIGASEEIHLRFWHWFSFASFVSQHDAGVVYIQERVSAGVWSDAAQLTQFTQSSGGVWTYPLVDLSAHGGKTVRFRFSIQSRNSFNTGSGWYIDDVSIVVGGSDN